MIMDILSICFNFVTFIYVDQDQETQSPLQHFRCLVKVLSYHWIHLLLAPGLTVGQYLMAEMVVIPAYGKISTKVFHNCSKSLVKEALILVIYLETPVASPTADQLQFSIFIVSISIVHFIFAFLTFLALIICTLFQFCKENKYSLVT